MKALAMPSSSRTAMETFSACFWVNSPRIFDERSATSLQTFASSAASASLAWRIPHDAIRADAALCPPRVIEVVQVGYRLAHGKEGLVRIQRPAKKHTEQLPGAPRPFAQGIYHLPEALLVVLLELGDALVRAAKGLAVRGQHEHVLGKLAITGDG